jgi:hypothetical protein
MMTLYLPNANADPLRMDAHPEMAISQEEFERGLREQFPFLDEKAPAKMEAPTP